MGNEMQHVDEGTIHAWLDGALAPDESRRVEAHVGECGRCAEAVAEARGLIAASSRVLSALDAVPGGVIPGTPRETDRLAELRRRASTPRRGWWRNRQFLAAASLVLIAGTAATAWEVWNRVNAIPMQASSESPADRAPASVASTPVAVPSSRDEAASKREVATRAERAAAPAPVAAEPPRAAASPVPGVEVEARSLKAEPTRLAAAAEAVENKAEVPRRTDSVGFAERRLPSSIALPTAAQALNEQRATGQAGAVGVLDATARGAATLAAEARRRATPARPGLPGHLGCYALRSEGAANTLLLGVPATVRLLNEVVLRDSAWMRATSPDVAEVTTSLIWRSVDSATVELHVRRPMDSTMVRFKAVLEGAPLSPVAGMLRASAERVVCPGG